VTRRRFINGAFILFWLTWANFRAVVRALPRGPLTGGREVIRATRRLWQAATIVVTQSGRTRVAHLVRHALECGVSRERLARNSAAAACIAGWLNDDQQYDAAITTVRSFLIQEPQYARFYGIRGMAYLGLGRFNEALADLTLCHHLNPYASKDMNFDLYRSYLHGLRGENEAAQQAMAAQMLPFGFAGHPESALAAFLAKRLADPLAKLDLRGTVGIVIGSFHSAVGHAVLDPFHFLQLYRHRFDRLILIRPPDWQFTPPTRLAADILDQYIDRIDVNDSDVLNFTWQSMGELRHENLTFLVHNYWSLNRMAYFARTSSDHPMSQGRDYLALPPRLMRRAEAICRRNHLEMTRPVVVVHAREHGYHGLHGQRYRNVDIRNYIPALRRLVSLGYQVVRIGDKKMMSIRADVPGLLELPATDFYDPALDPFLISRCRFMISCQSGPCSYARVFGKPNLVLNAVYHFTLLPEQNELIAFKQYLDAKSSRPLTVEEIFNAGAHLFNRTEHFEANGIEVEDMTAEEIFEATEEMLAWLDEPARPETATQQLFRKIVKRYGGEPKVRAPEDYIGYALPECRVSEAVCRLRPGYLPAVEALNDSKSAMHPIRFPAELSGESVRRVA
jgi:putative glycosyltransferase (TIGR04372 family)